MVKVLAGQNNVSPWVPSVFVKYSSWYIAREAILLNIWIANVCFVTIQLPVTVYP